MTTKESMHIDPYERAWIIVSQHCVAGGVGVCVFIDLK
jgi:hypothetical protein